MIWVNLFLTGDGMASFKALPKQTRHYAITNTAELLPLSSLIKQFLDEECVTQKTREIYEVGLRYYVQFSETKLRRSAATLTYSDITRKLVADFKDARLEIDAPATAEIRVRTVKRFCNWMQECHQVRNPAREVRGVEVPETEFKGLTDGQYRRLVKLAQSQTDPVDRFLPLLYVETGLRAGEVRYLTVGQISDDIKWFLRVVGKSRGSRAVPITDFLFPELQTYLCWREQFPMGAHTPLIPSASRMRRGVLPNYSNVALHNIVKAMMLEANVPADLAHAHTLRHTFAYRTRDRLLKDYGAQGMNPAEAMSRTAHVLMKVMGHRDWKTTMKYLGIQQDDFNNAFHGARA